jgi:Flp pilus assembly protein TadG
MFHPRRFAKNDLKHDARAGVTLEFAVVSLPFLLFLVFLLELGYDFFAQVALDYGVQSAARQIQVGKAQGAATVAIFQTNYLCPALSGLLPCSSVAVNIAPITTDYYTAVPAHLPTGPSGQLNTSGFTYCPGRPNQLMLVQAIYTSPSLISALIPGMATSTAGGLARVTLSSTAFINENFPVTSAPPAGC